MQTTFSKGKNSINKYLIPSFFFKSIIASDAEEVIKGNVYLCFQYTGSKKMHFRNAF